MTIVASTQRINDIEKQEDEIVPSAIPDTARLQEKWFAFKKPLSHMPSFICTFDLEGRFKYVNQAVLWLWKKSLTDAIGKTFFDLDYPKGLAERLQSQIQKAIRSRAPVWDRTSCTGLNGETRDHEYIFIPVLDADGRATSVVGSTRDITEQRRAIEERLRSEESLSSAFEAGGGLGTWDWNVQEDRVYCNSAFANLFSVDVERALKGVPINEFTQSIHPEDRSGVTLQIQHSVESGDEFTSEYRVVQSNKSVRWVLARGRCHRDKTGNPTHFPGVVFEITQRKKLDEALLRKNRELEEFAYLASHDLQEPLRMVRIYTQLLVKHCEDQKLKEFADFVQTGTERMECLLHDLLDLSRNTYEDALPVGTADLSLCLQEARSVLESRIAETGAIITAARLPIVKGGEVQLSHVFQNLLSNALKYRRADIPPIIDVSFQTEENVVITSFKDNGIGFEQRYAEHIFGLFKRLHNKTEFDGTGLGLAICKRIVERYGGQIWADSQLGVGSSFHFSLPMS